MVRKPGLSFWLVALCTSVAFSGSFRAAAIDLGDLQISPQRIPVWNPGVEGGVPDTSGWPTVSATSYGATANDSSDDTAAINAAINYAAGLGGNRVVTLPAGTFRFIENAIYLKSNVVLRGAGSMQTTLSGIRGDGGSAIYSLGSAGSAINVTNSSLPKGTATITLASVSGLSVGDWLHMEQNNDTSYIQNPAPCGLNCKIYMTHMFKIKGINGNNVTMDRPLRHAFNTSLNPRVQKMSQKENTGIEDLKLMFDINASPRGGDTIHFEYTVNSWLKNLYLYNGYSSHVSFRWSSRNTVRDSKTERLEKWELDGDYSGNYSIVVVQGSHDNLFTNNITLNVRSGVMMSRGSSGNVYSYNYGDGILSKMAFLHGQHPHENLIEGNDGDGQFKADNYWGQQGPRNTMFRNRMRDGGAFVLGLDRTEWPVAPSFNLLLNTAHTFHRKPFCDYDNKGNCGDIDENASDFWAERNIARDLRPSGQPSGGSEYGWVLKSPGASTVSIENHEALKPPSSWQGSRAPASLYLSGPPDFWGADMPWPAIRADMDDFTGGGPVKLPAQLRHEGVEIRAAGNSPPGGGDTTTPQDPPESPPVQPPASPPEVPTDGEAILTDDFQTRATGQYVPGWVDTRAGNSMVEDDSLFGVTDLGSNRVFGTSSTLTNIHSHYVSGESAGLSAYEFRGRMLITDPNAGIGVTVHSQYPNADTYYRIMRWQNSDFYMEAHPYPTPLECESSRTGTVPQANRWYRFRLEVAPNQNSTSIRAKVWLDGASEPATWQIRCEDRLLDRPGSGTVGVWSMSAGSKYWDDLAVIDPLGGVNPPGGPDVPPGIPGKPIIIKP